MHSALLIGVGIAINPDEPQFQLALCHIIHFLMHNLCLYNLLRYYFAIKSFLKINVPDKAYVTYFLGNASCLQTTGVCQLHCNRCYITTPISSKWLASVGMQNLFSAIVYFQKNKNRCLCKTKHIKYHLSLRGNGLIIVYKHNQIILNSICKLNLISTRF